MDPTRIVPLLIEMIYCNVAGSAVASFLTHIKAQGYNRYNFFKRCEEEAFKDFTTYLLDYLKERCPVGDKEEDDIEGITFEASAISAIPPQFTPPAFAGFQRQAAFYAPTIYTQAGPSGIMMTALPPVPPLPQQDQKKKGKSKAKPSGEKATTPKSAKPAENQNNYNNRPRTQRGCTICGTVGHPAHKCPLSCEQRKEALQKARKCFNCLSTGHSARNCQAPHNCRFCAPDGKSDKFKHITFICKRQDADRHKSRPPVKNEGGGGNETRVKAENASENAQQQATEGNIATAAPSREHPFQARPRRAPTGSRNFTAPAGEAINETDDEGSGGEQTNDI